ncbi:NAD(P)H:quinone oxidoreductase, type IV [Radiomyces spectabilis]|uniref:NAD(P)H:quinone oxidoreductase, type IV n=1 Tax=Radiomyces spectabilis TaxID=64574 RepID=UPI00221F8C68|nr:NAD(P)H:quinone oxidoreductase, type IV [Radiomyces spectabilis]KAI8374255.1 NAD(P)H:quinone oxidoreductase, type IV [Radiomyces spectabilis]
MSAGKVYIVSYSVYHHVHKLALEIQKGLRSTGVTTKMFQVQETLSDDVLKMIKAPPKPDIPVIKPEQLAEADGILFGMPTRFGTMPAQMKGLLDGTGGLWAKGTLHSKFAGTFFSTASQHGGQETTALTTVTYFAHHGMMYVPLGFTHPNLSDNSELIGGSAYGAGTIANGDGSRQPTAKELEIAYSQGAHFGDVVSAYLRGKQAKPN